MPSREVQVYCVQYNYGCILILCMSVQYIDHPNCFKNLYCAVCILLTT